MTEDFDPEVAGSLLIGAGFASLVFIAGAEAGILSTNMEASANPTTLLNITAIVGSAALGSWASIKILG